MGTVLQGKLALNISDEGLELVKKFEGCRLTSYQDAVGVWTIGYGSTRGVSANMVIGQEEAEERLRTDMHEAENCINKLVSAALTQHEFDALCSFVFNLGCGAFRGSTLLRKLNAGDYDGAALEFTRWTKAGGRELPGLVARREAEQTLFEAA